MKGESDDRIHIEQLKIVARVGVSESERARSQRVAVSITIWPRFQADDLGDDVTKTVDYSKLCQEAKKFVQGRADKLIETLADALAEHLLRKFAIRRVTVELRKFVLKGADYVSVTVNRTAALG
jgi:dihydroneopterin aldolase/2-amino-4-hydroxy-6-hydroxymethyldihydropteridine diphosphokinase